MLFAIIVALSCMPKSKEEKKFAGDSVNEEHTIVIDTNLINNIDKSPLDFFVDKHADSINNAVSVGQLPSFLKEIQFDYQNAGILSSFHSPLPLRKLIINKVTNCASLRLIFEEKSGIYKNKPQKQHDIEVEFINLSVYDLARKRFKELNCN